MGVDEQILSKNMAEPMPEACHKPKQDILGNSPGAEGIQH